MNKWKKAVSLHPIVIKANRRRVWIPVFMQNTYNITLYSWEYHTIHISDKKSLSILYYKTPLLKGFVSYQDKSKKLLRLMKFFSTMIYMDISYSATTIDKLYRSLICRKPFLSPRYLEIYTASPLRCLKKAWSDRIFATVAKDSRRIREVSQELSWHHSAESSSRNLISSYFTFAPAFLALFPAEQTIIYHVVNSSWGFHMVRREAGRGRGKAERSRERSRGWTERGEGGGETQKKTEEARRRVKEGIVEGESVVVTNILRVAVGYNAAARMTDTPLA